MGKQARLKKERREARIQAGIKRGERGEKVGNLDDLTDDAEKLLKQMHNHVKSRIKLAVVQAHEKDYGTPEDQAHVRSGVSCGNCKANKGCCFMSVSALMFEGLPIARHLKKAGKDTPDLRSKLRTQGKAMESMAIDDWYDTSTPCVFLDEEQRCGIYAVRPSACRHHVVFSPPENCSPPKNKQTLQFGSEKELVTAYGWNVSIATSFFGFDDPGKSGQLLIASLPRVVLMVLESLDKDDYAEALREQDWPTLENPPKMTL